MDDRKIIPICSYQIYSMLLSSKFSYDTFNMFSFIFFWHLKYDTFRS